MDTLKRADIKGKRVRVTDDSGCKFIGVVENVDYQRGKLGVTGTVEGLNTGKSLQIFYRTDIKKIVVFDDTPAVFAKIPAHNLNKQTFTASSQPGYVLMPGGAEHRVGINKAGRTHGLGSTGHTSDSSDKEKSSEGPLSPTYSIPLNQGDTGSVPPLLTGQNHVPYRTTPVSEIPRVLSTSNKATPVFARVSANISPPSQVMNRAVPPSTTAPCNTPYQVNTGYDQFRPYQNVTAKPVSLSMVRDHAGYPCYIMPSVITSPNLPVRDRERVLLTKGVKELLWPSLSTPPSFTTPSRLYYVEKEGDLFEEAIVRLSDSNRLGISMEGQVLGRNGKTSLLVISSQEEVYIFDLLAMGINAFKWGLYSVLRNSDVVKVVHDCRQVSDTLYHQYGVQLENVFDTLAGHVVFSNWLLKSEQKVAKHLDCTIKDYLGVPDEHLYTTHYSSSSLKSDTSMWLSRPLSVNLIVGAARNCIFLLALARIMERAVQLPVEKAIQAMMVSSTTKTTEESKQMLLTPQYLPNEVLDSLPRWKQVDCRSRC